MFIHSRLLFFKNLAPRAGLNIPHRRGSQYVISRLHAFSSDPLFTNIGEVCTNMLHNVYAALVGAHGFSTTAKTNPGTQGNVVFLHLFLDALCLQPCNPTCKRPSLPLTLYFANAPFSRHGARGMDTGRPEPLRRCQLVEGLC